MAGAGGVWKAGNFATFPIYDRAQVDKFGVGALSAAEKEQVGSQLTAARTRDQVENAYLWVEKARMQAGTKRPLTQTQMQAFLKKRNVARRPDSALSGLR